MNVFFISGVPGAGKSYLTRHIADRSGAKVVSVDEAYVEFIRTKFPEVYFPALRNFIMGHYGIFSYSRYYAGQVLGKDLIALWQQHLAFKVKEELRKISSILVVDGYQLGLDNCLEFLRRSIGEQAATTEIEVVKEGDRRVYRYEGKCGSLGETVDFIVSRAGV
jgi:hypothetical protein